jgi:hypothetical protein
MKAGWYKGASYKVQTYDGRVIVSFSIPNASTGPREFSSEANDLTDALVCYIDMVNSAQVNEVPTTGSGYAYTSPVTVPSTFYPLSAQATQATGTIT